MSHQNTRVSGDVPLKNLEEAFRAGLAVTRSDLAQLRVEHEEALNLFRKDRDDALTELAKLREAKAHPDREVINPGLLAAVRKYADWAIEFNSKREQPDWFYVHADENGHRVAWDMGATLTRIADLLEANHIAFLKLRHLEKVMGVERVEYFLGKRS